MGGELAVRAADIAPLCVVCWCPQYLKERCLPCQVRRWCVPTTQFQEAYATGKLQERRSEFPDELTSFFFFKWNKNGRTYSIWRWHHYTYYIAYVFFPTLHCIDILYSIHTFRHSYVLYIILPVVLYGCGTWSLTLKEEHDWGCLGEYLDRKGMKG
jgi:hypothetical protein